MGDTNANAQRPHTVVWSEIPVTDMTRAMSFYGEVLQRKLTERTDGPNPMADLPSAGDDSVSAHLYPGKPAPEGTGNTIHLAVPDSLEATMERVRTAGGRVTSEAIPIPSVGRFFYALDPDGNSLGFFER